MLLRNSLWHLSGSAVPALVALRGQLSEDEILAEASAQMRKLQAAGIRLAVQGTPQPR